MAQPAPDPTGSSYARLLFLSGRVHWWVLGAAPLMLLGVAGAVSLGWYQPRKVALESLALGVTGGFTALCLVRYALTRSAYFLWATALTATLFAREIRFPGDSIVYVALALLGWIALRRFDEFRDRLAHPWLLTALALGFLTYAITVSIDQRWLRVLPNEEVWHVPVEETLEVAGHVVIGLALAWSPVLLGTRPRRSRAPTGSQGNGRLPRG